MTNRLDRARVPFTRQELKKLERLCIELEKLNVPGLSSDISALRQRVSELEAASEDSSDVTMAQVATRVSLQI